MTEKEKIIEMLLTLSLTYTIEEIGPYEVAHIYFGKSYLGCIDFLGDKLTLDAQY